MEDETSQHRILAVDRFKHSERPESICTSLGKSKVWLYKWLKRYSEEEASWCEDHSRRPLSTPLHTSAEIEEIVKMVHHQTESADQNLCGNIAECTFDPDLDSTDRRPDFEVPEVQVPVSMVAVCHLAH